jgi:glycosyltransferase involved in cell wall biosynthesis
VENRVIFHGALAGAPSLYPAFDVFVLSSRSEGTPIALFEAMSAAIPIVATSVGGVPDVVSEAEAWVVPVDSSALATAVDDVLARPAGAESRAAAARARLGRQFAPGPWLDQYASLYAAVAGERVR